MNKSKTPNHQTIPDNGGKQAVDKAPGEERGKREKLTAANLKGKKVDADPARDTDKPTKNNR